MLIDSTENVTGMTMTMKFTAVTQTYMSSDILWALMSRCLNIVWDICIHKVSYSLYGIIRIAQFSTQGDSLLDQLDRYNLRELPFFLILPTSVSGTACNVQLKYDSLGNDLDICASMKQWQENKTNVESLP